jgi:hypothetical protein
MRANHSIRQSSIAGLALAASMLAAPSVADAQSWQEVSRTGSNSSFYSDSSFVCALTGMQGDFADDDYDGGREFVQVTHDQGRYRLETGPGRTGRMVCANMSNFARPAGSTLMRFSDFVSIDNVNSDHSQNKNMFWGDAVTMISQVRGEFQSDQEYVQVTQSTNPSTPSVLRGRTTVGDFFDETSLGGGAHSVFMGNPNNHTLVKLIGYNTQGNLARGNVSSSGTFEMPVNTHSGFSSYWLSTTTGNNSGLCYFTKLSGDFNGNGESATITVRNGRWFLEAKYGGVSRGTNAKARCLAYDQR